MKKKHELTFREHLEAIQSLGGKARWAGLSPEEILRMWIGRHRPPVK
jgi:hypothetical protein